MLIIDIYNFIRYIYGHNFYFQKNKSDVAKRGSEMPWQDCFYGLLSNGSKTVTKEGLPTKSDFPY